MRNKARPAPPGTLRLAWYDLCRGYYYGSEAEHRERFHGGKADVV